MKITIITATYNSAAHIARCLASVNKQTYPNIEHIIIDGASTDNTLEIIKTTENRVAQLISEPDHGIYDAINKGSALANGEIIGLLHSDDIFANESVIAKIAHEFENKNIGGIFGNLVIINKNGKTLRKWRDRPFNKNKYKFGWMPAHPTLFLRKEVFEKYGPYNTNYKIAGDYAFLLRILKDNKIKFNYVSIDITVMRAGGASSKNLRSLWLKSNEDYKALTSNKIKLPFIVLLLKNLRKIPQFIIR
jgi:glycosyltransferase